MAYTGCLQSIYGIHTFRIESIAHGGAAPVDELQVQGVYSPGNLRKVKFEVQQFSFMTIECLNICMWKECELVHKIKLYAGNSK